MTVKLLQSPWAKAATVFWLSNLDKFFFYLFLLLLPTQFGKHFWFPFSYVAGQRIDYLSPTLYVTDILLALLFLCVLMQKKIIILPVFSLSVLFVSFSIFLSRSPLIGWYALLKFLEISFLVWYVSHAIFSKEVAGILLWIGVVFEVLVSTVQLFLQHSVGGFLYYLGERTFAASTPGIANASINGQLILRPYATFAHPNMLAGYLVVVPLLIIFLLHGKKYIAFVWSGFLLATLGLGLSLSREAMVTWFLCGGIELIFANGQKMGKKILLLLFSLGTVFLLTSIFFRPISGRFFSLSFGQSLTERIFLNGIAFQMIIAHPLFGIGLGNFISSLPFYTRQTNFLQPVHNIYLLIAAETGLVGLFVFVGFLITVGRGFPRMRNFSLWLAFLAMLFLGLFDHYFLTLQQGQLLFGVVLGFMLREKRHATIQQ